MATNNSWSASTIAKLKTLLERGLTTSEIGKRLGFTKNAVVGKINRLKLNTVAKKVIVKKAPKPKIAPKPKKVLSKAKPILKKKVEKVLLNFVTLMELFPDQCRWPIGSPDSEDFKFCGKKCFSGKPYCFEHCKLAYQFVMPSKKRKT